MLVSTKSRTVQMIGSSCSGANGGAWSGATIAIGSPVRWKRYTARICRSPAARRGIPNASASPDVLEEARPKRTLYPWGQKGLAVTLEHWGHQVLEERVWRYVVTKVPPVLKSDEERWVFEEMQTRARGPWHVLEMRREEFRQDMKKHLAMVDSILDGRDWILGQPSLADFGIYGSMSPLLTVGESVPSEFPRLAAWVSRVRDLRSPVG